MLPAAAATSQVEYGLDLKAIVLQDLGQRRRVLAHHFRKHFVLSIYNGGNEGSNAIGAQPTEAFQLLFVSR